MSGISHTVDGLCKNLYTQMEKFTTPGSTFSSIRTDPSSKTTIIFHKCLPNSKQKDSKFLCVSVSGTTLPPGIKNWGEYIKANSELGCVCNKAKTCL